MARYSAAHSRQTRQRIVNAARRRFKRDGIQATGLTALLADAGLTNGAFYKHFDSKDDLVATVIAYDMDKRLEWLATEPTGRAAVEKLVRAYCDEHHRDHAETGCLSAALLPEIARSDPSARRAYTQGLRAYLRLLGGHLRQDHGDEADDVALELLTLIFGYLQLARAVDDPLYSDRIIELSLAAALARLTPANTITSRE